MAFEKKFQGDIFLDQISVDKDKLTSVIKQGKHPDKMFDWAFQIEAQHRHKECKFKDKDIVCQILMDQLIYTQISTPKLS